MEKQIKKLIVKPIRFINYNFIYVIVLIFCKKLLFRYIKLIRFNALTILQFYSVLLDSVPDSIVSIVSILIIFERFMVILIRCI